MLAAADRLWGQQGFSFVPAFLDRTREFYGAELAQADFRSAPDQARAAVNAWVNSQTRGRVPDLMPSGSVTADTRLVRR